MAEGVDEAVAAGGSVRRALDRARAALDANPAARPSLADMARAARVSSRTLQRHFATVLASAPQAVLLRWRLEAARRTLAAGEAPSVLAGALGHGFDHPGRFAVAYRQAFGEPPSATLRGARSPEMPPRRPSATLVSLRAFTSAEPQDAARARRLTDDLAMALTRARDLALADDAQRTPPHDQALTLDGRLEGDSVVLSLKQPARATVLWMDRAPLASRAGLGWADRAVGALAAAVAAYQVEQARRTPRRRADAGTLYARARPAAMALESGTVDVALDLLQELLHRDPTHARAQALVGWCQAQGANHNFTHEPDAARACALEHGRRALALAPDDPEVLTFVAGVLSLTRHLDESLRLVDRSLALDPNQPEAWRRRAFIYNFRGDGVRAAGAFERALAAWPTGGDANMALIGLGVARFITGDYARSARALSRALDQQPSRAWPYRFLTAAAMHAGAREAARRSLLSLQRAFPDLTVDRCARSGVLHREALTRVLDGLARSGLPR